MKRNNQLLTPLIAIVLGACTIPPIGYGLESEGGEGSSPTEVYTGIQKEMIYILGVDGLD